jgi:hypothetical protein
VDRSIHRQGPQDRSSRPGRGEAAQPQLHRYRAHSSRAHPRGRGRRDQGFGIARHLARESSSAGRGDHRRRAVAPSGHIPFTPRAKKVLELSLREALQLGHNYIGTEHILLGLIREGEGVAAQVLVKLGADLGHVRQQVTRFLSGVSDPTESSHWIPFLRELRDSFPRVGIVALLSDDSTQDLASIALEAGATCYVMKGDPGEKVAFAVREAANLNKPEA